jgi:hypothetical protein
MLIGFDRGGGDWNGMARIVEPEMVKSRPGLPGGGGGGAQNVFLQV